jgi:DNA invertase Pin-like site-specific DNA recombinase
MRAGVYMRVSTDDQNTELQRRELLAYCKARGWEAIEYTDEGVSGRKDSRPELDRLWQDVRARKVDVVLVWAYDRFGRQTIALLKALQELRDLKVGFVSIREQVDTTTAAGELMFTMLAGLAQYESSQIGIRVKAGMAAAKAAGRRISRPQLVPRDTVKQRAASGWSAARIAVELGAHPATIRRILRRAG